MGKSKSFLVNAGLLFEFIRFRPNLSRLVARIVEPQDIDDILQETYIRICAASVQVEIANPKSFMLKTAQNLAINYVTTAYKRRIRPEGFLNSAVEPITEDFESQFDSKERFMGFCRAVRTLPTQCRRAFVLRKVYGLSQQEIAAYLEISESTVEKHVAKGVLLCREAMLRMGHLETGQANSRGNDGIQRRKG